MDYNLHLSGGGFTMDITNDYNAWQYEIKNSKGDVVYVGGDFESYEQLITECSEQAEALKGIFG
jgi:hypothetical protein